MLCRKVEFNLNNILLIDGNAILTRCFYGIRPLTSSEGRPTSVKRHLEECGRSNVALSEKLVTICKDVPVDIQILDIFVHPYDESKLHPFLSSLGLQSFCTSKHKKLC